MPLLQASPPRPELPPRWTSLARPGLPLRWTSSPRPGPRGRSERLPGRRGEPRMPAATARPPRHAAVLDAVSRRPLRKGTRPPRSRLSRALRLAPLARDPRPCEAKRLPSTRRRRPKPTLPLLPGGSSRRFAPRSATEERPAAKRRRRPAKALHPARGAALDAATATRPMVRRMSRPAGPGRVQPPPPARLPPLEPMSRVSYSTRSRPAGPPVAPPRAAARQPAPRRREAMPHRPRRGAGPGAPSARKSPRPVRLSSPRERRSAAARP
jgi:hypothetical protein